MSVGEQTQTPGSPAQKPGEETADAGLPVNRGDAAGRLLGRLSVLPALLAMPWLLAGLPLLLAGQFRVVPMLAVALPLAVISLVLGLRWVPGTSHSALAPARPALARTPWWAVAGVLVVAVAFGADQAYYHSDFIIVLRDPAAYVQFGDWIAGHGSLPIPENLAAFGGGHPGLSFGSFAFYQVNNVVIPQFMAGLPMVLAASFWAHGVTAAVLTAPLLGACGVLTFGGLVARLVGPRWAPAGALVLAVSLPEQFTSRSDYSEPLTQLLLLAGLCLVVDALNTSGKGSRVLAALGGLALGLTLLVRIDGASDMLPLIPYLGLLFVQRRPQALPMFCGLLVGTVLGGVDGAVLSWPYLDSISSSLDPLLIVAGVVAVATVAVTLLLRRRGLPSVRGNWLANAGSAVAVLVTVGFTVRPYLQQVRSAPGSPAAMAVAGYQHDNGLPLDPTRLYYEMSMDWVFWYIGVPAVVLATLGAFLLSRQCLRGRAPTWLLPLMTFAWAIVTTLYLPNITPDQPWASRRLVPAVLPGFILLAVWGLSWIVGQLRRMVTLQRALYVSLLAVCLALLVLPGAVTTYGIRPRHGGPVGVRLVSVSTAFTPIHRGEIGQVRHMCASLPADSSVVIIDNLTGEWFGEVIRGMCGVPTGIMPSPTQATVGAVVQGIISAGRRPVLMGTSPQQLEPYGAASKRIFFVNTRQDESSLVHPPTQTWPFSWSIWASEPA